MKVLATGPILTRRDGVFMVSEVDIERPSFKTPLQHLLSLGLLLFPAGTDCVFWEADTKVEFSIVMLMRVSAWSQGYRMKGREGRREGGRGEPQLSKAEE